MGVETVEIKTPRTRNEDKQCNDIKGLARQRKGEIKAEQHFSR
jgi:hypothetical protein